jgi:hypothetical protein
MDAETEESTAGAFFWPGHAFFSPLLLQWFCAGSVRKLTTLSTQQVLDSSDEIGAAANLLQFVALRVHACLTEATPSSVRMLCCFVGKSGAAGIAAGVSDEEADAVRATVVRLFAVDMGAIVAAGVVAMEGKVGRLGSKLNKRQRQDVHGSDNSTVDNNISSSSGSSVVGNSSSSGSDDNCNEREETHSAQDLLRLEVLLDNLTHLRSILSTFQ